MYNKEKYQKDVFRLDRPDFEEEFVFDAQEEATPNFEAWKHERINNCEAHSVVLDMIAHAFHKAIDPWEMVGDSDYVLTFKIGVCPMDNWPYLLLMNTGHQLNWTDKSFVLIEPDALKSRRYFESIEDLVKSFINQKIKILS